MSCKVSDLLTVILWRLLLEVCVELVLGLFRV